MAGIKVGFPFTRTSSAPIDESFVLTKEQMRAVNDSHMPEKYFTVCADDGKLYIYDKSVEKDETTGRYREYKVDVESALGYTPYEKPVGGIPLTDLKVLRLKNVNLWIDDLYPYVPLSDLFHDLADLKKACGPTSIYDVAYTDMFTPKNGSSIDLGETEIFQPRTLLIVDSYQRSLPLEGKYEYSFSLWSQMGYTIRYTVSVNYGTFPQAGDLAKVEITRNMTQEALDDALEGKQPLINAQNKLDYSLLSNTPVFYATYGSTTAAEIQAAYNAGKIVLCLYNTAVYALANINETWAHFGALFGTNAKWVRVLVSNNRWETGLQALEVITNRVTLLDASATDTKYPTAKAVVDYVENSLNDKYTKPASGIPKSDMAEDVKASLNKANSALQSYTETDPTVPGWAKAPAKPTYTAQEVGALPDDTVIPDVPAISTSIAADAASDAKTASPKAVKTYVDGIVGDIETLLAAL